MAGGLNDLANQISGSILAPEAKLPPVDKWNPPFCGDIDMEIRPDGTWYYLGTPIGRPALVKLFSSVLRKDADGKTYLVTPVEKVGIRVVDAPFAAVEMNMNADKLVFRTNVDEMITVGRDHPLRFEVDAANHGVKPYIHVRGRLEALATRPVMYELIGQGFAADMDGRQMFVVRSGAELYPVMEMSELEKAMSNG